MDRKKIAALIEFPMNRPVQQLSMEPARLFFCEDSNIRLRDDRDIISIGRERGAITGNTASVRFFASTFHSWF